MIASSPLVIPARSSPSTVGLRYETLVWVVKGSEKDPEGGEMNGGGKGRVGRLAKIEYPVSK